MSETWRRYYDAAGLDPRETLLVALERFEAEGRDGVPFAVDLGCGTGRDTHELLRRGWRVLAIDSQAQALERLLAGVDPDALDRVETRVARFEDAEWPEADLVNASFALPFCSRADFGLVWERIVASLPAGGRFCGQLFGDHDEWATGSMRAFPAKERPDMTFLSRAEVEELLHPFEVEHLVEVDEEGATAVGEPKHWHLFHVVARKR